MGMEVAVRNPYLGGMTEEKPRFFRSGAEYRRWLEKNHNKAPAIWIGFWKAASGKKGITYVEAVAESLCFGWIDGLLRSHGEDSFQQRYTPRRKGSTWSAVNLRKIEALKAEGRVTPAGLAVFEGRDPKRAGRYSFENRHITMSAQFEKKFRAKKAAWKFFEAQPPGYRRLAAFWVMSAKKEETRLRRLDRLMNDSAHGVRVAVIG